MKLLSTITLLLISLYSSSQTTRWQQHVDYTINVTLNAATHQFTGNQKLMYTNNSPDTLKKVFYHLYFNAFQPGSMMDERSRAIEDPDSRVKDRISKLRENEIGKIYPTNLMHDGKPVKYTVVGTVLEVILNRPILPHSMTIFEMDFEGQVPIQIRRSGRNNKEGIDYSMTQWYPKISEYDYSGWHANPYVGREFHGVWGNFDVSITLEKKYIIAATGVLQNKNKIGYGYQDSGTTVKHKKNKMLTWNFIAKNVHDFAWAADPDYLHKTIQIPNGPKMHFFYQEDSLTTSTWTPLIEIAPAMFSFINKNFGEYPYTDFSVIQGGDGGMEYPMATLISGRRNFNSLLSVTIHELIHSWYQGVLASNESLYPWMDEGFTTYASNKTKSFLLSRVEKNPQLSAYNTYYYLTKEKKQEPLTTHADHFTTNMAYGIGSYSMGAMVPSILEYIVGKENFENAFRVYFNTWKFKHPNPNDFIRVIEKETGFELDWFLNNWIGTTHYIDYAIDSVYSNNLSNTKVLLANKGTAPMPTEVLVTYTNGESELFYFPLRMMRKSKTEFLGVKYKLMNDWPWTNPTMEFNIPQPMKNISTIELNQNKNVPDINQLNDIWSNK